MAEDFAAKMGRKTDAELLLYLQNRAEYQEQAVLAALEEAERRQVLPAGLDAARLRAELGPVVAQQQADEAQRYTEAQAAEVTADEPGPRLYSPVTITLFSVFFSMLAGGALLAINFRTLHRKGAIGRLILFIIGYLVLVGLLMGPLVRAGMVMLLLFAELPAIIAYNLWFWPRYVGVYHYQSRGWLLPFLICSVLRFGLMLLLAPFLSQQLEALKQAM
ncbi:hypothetical protein K3G63_19125 [Hymenobacter sp. HSC-4F20]|uniref:hypothetical protein n=1 Tax=Hymenobacter sp. HSC-4F20 TaxID=2864135 RepID=UPI001C734890|nr:hypothetical protein [Hymenobacter sp. HSC-4F20]MBX0292564.1 hypothetical protein [Hymenobacter sp. HSC-4F20]